MTAYALTFGGFLLLGGRTGDLFGRRRAFTFGLLLFAAASLVGGFAQSEGMLLASRAAQGLGAAFASPNALALITTTFEPGPKRSRAFAVYAMMSGLGAAVGLLLGGWLTGSDLSVLGYDVHGWRLTFFINVPIGIAAALAAPKLLVESDRHAGHLDVPGAVTATAGLLSLVFGITRAGDRSYGWGDTWTLVAMGVGVVLLAIFWLLERGNPQPLLPGRILADRNRAAAYGTMMLIPAAMFTMFFFLTLVLQNVMGESPMTTGLMFLPFSVAMIIAATQVSKLVQRFDPGKLAGIGAVIASVAVFGFSRMPYDDSLPGLGVDINYWTHVFPFILLMPVGMALVFIPTTMSVLHGVSPRDSGIASGVLNTMQQVGGALGLALLSTIAFNAQSDKLTQLCGDLAQAGTQCSPDRPDPLRSELHPRRDRRLHGRLRDAPGRWPDLVHLQPHQARRPRERQPPGQRPGPRRPLRNPLRTSYRAVATAAARYDVRRSSGGVSRRRGASRRRRRGRGPRGPRPGRHRRGRRRA